MSYIQTWKVQSDSDEDLFYNVSLADNGTYACACKGWTQHFPRKNCRHIKKLLAAMYTGEALVQQKPTGTKVASGPVGQGRMDAIYGKDKMIWVEPKGRQGFWRRRTDAEQMPPVRGRVQPVQDAATGKPLRREASQQAARAYKATMSKKQADAALEELIRISPPPSRASMDKLKTELEGVYEKRPEKKRRLIEL